MTLHKTEDGLEMGFLDYAQAAQAIEVSEVETIEAAPICNTLGDALHNAMVPFNYTY